MRRILLVAGFMAIVLTVSVAFAQEGMKPETKEAPEKAPEKQPEAPAEETPAEETPAEETPAEEPEKDLKPVTGEKVWVRLKKGDVIDGVVKGLRAEVQKGARFLKAKDKDEPGAGIRVWYVSGMNGYMFFPYTTVDDIEFKGQLTRDEGIELARQIDEEQARSERDRVRVAQELEAKRRATREAVEKKKAAEEGGDAGEAAEEGPVAATKPAKGATRDAGEAKPSSDAERAGKIRELLRRFPPQEWKPSRLAEIKDRQLILNIYPNDEERAFMDGYDLWLEGYEIWRKQKAAGSR